MLFDDAEGMASEYKFSKYNIYLDESKGLVYNAVSTFENHTMDIDISQN